MNNFRNVLLSILLFVVVAAAQTASLYPHDATFNVNLATDVLTNVSGTVLSGNQALSFTGAGILHTITCKNTSAVSGPTTWQFVAQTDNSNYYSYIVFNYQSGNIFKVGDVAVNGTPSTGAIAISPTAGNSSPGPSVNDQWTVHIELPFSTSLFVTYGNGASSATSGTQTCHIDFSATT